MDKQQAAEARIPDSPFNTPRYAEYLRKEFIAGWEAHEAQQSSSKEIDILCPSCNGDGFIKTTTRQSDGTFEIDCETCKTDGRIQFIPSASPPQPAGSVWVKCSIRLPENIQPPQLVIFKWTHPKNPMVFSTLSYTANQFLDKSKAQDLSEWEWLDESNTQQLFTRDQVCDICYAMGKHFDDVPTLAEMREFMDTNYPTTIK